MPLFSSLLSSIFSYPYKYPSHPPSSSAVIVTGHTTGIGNDLCLKLYKLGYKVYAVGRSKVFEGTVVGVNSGEIVEIMCDVGKEEDVRRALAVVKEGLGMSYRFDLLLLLFF